MSNALTENIFVKLALCAVVVFCVITLFTANTERQELTAAKNELLMQIERTNDEILSLENDLAQPYSDEYIIKTARKKLNMRLPEEIVFVTNIDNE